MARILVCILAVLPLMACGGAEGTLASAPSGGSGTGGTGGGGSGSLACALTGCEIAKLAVTGTMPTGSATYLGRASVARTDGTGTVVTTNAALQVNANFTSRSLTLQLSEFTDGSTNYTGTAQGSANVTGAQFAGNFAGNLTAANGLVPISGNVTGQFRGTGAVALDGDMVTNGLGEAFGRFFANKQ